MPRRQFTDEHRAKLSAARRKQWEEGRSTGIACYYNSVKYRSIAAACKAANINPYRRVNGMHIYQKISSTGIYVFSINWVNHFIVTDWKMKSRLRDILFDVCENATAST